MIQRVPIPAIAVFLLIACAVALYVFLPPNPADAAAATRAAEVFGAQLKLIPLNAEKEVVVESMDRYYAPLVEATLLTRWENDIANAPGRLTSSPWPEKLEVEKVTRTFGGEYRIEGRIVEVTSVEQAAEGGEARSYPVTLTMQKAGEKWVLVQYKQPPQ